MIQLFADPRRPHELDFGRLFLGVGIHSISAAEVHHKVERRPHYAEEVFRYPVTLETFLQTLKLTSVEECVMQVYPTLDDIHRGVVGWNPPRCEGSIPSMYLYSDSSVEYPSFDKRLAPLGGFFVLYRGGVYIVPALHNRFWERTIFRIEQDEVGFFRVMRSNYKPEFIEGKRRTLERVCQPAYRRKILFFDEEAPAWFIEGKAVRVVEVLRALIGLPLLAALQKRLSSLSLVQQQLQKRLEEALFS